MRYVSKKYAVALTYFMSFSSTYACTSAVEFIPEDVKYADIVVLGTVQNFNSVLDLDARRRRAEFKEAVRGTKLYDILNKSSGVSTDYALFDVHVDDVLKGSAGEVISITAQPFPKISPSGQYLIAIRHIRSELPPLRTAAATVFTPEGSEYTVLSAPCAPHFFLDPKSEEAKLVMDVLKKGARSDHD